MSHSEFYDFCLANRKVRIERTAQEYSDNGVRLHWLIDPLTRQVEVHRLGQRPEVLDNPATLNAAPELPGFVLDLSEIW